jgi:hypothetical protein
MAKVRGSMSIVDWMVLGGFFAVFILIAGILTFSASKGRWSLPITWVALSISGTLLLFLAARHQTDVLIHGGFTIAMTTGSMTLVVAALRHAGRGVAGQTLVAAAAGFTTFLLIARLTIRQ